MVTELASWYWQIGIVFLLFPLPAVGLLLLLICSTAPGAGVRIRSHLQSIRDRSTQKKEADSWHLVQGTFLSPESRWVHIKHYRLTIGVPSLW